MTQMAEDPQLRSMGWTREQERDYIAFQEDQDAVHQGEQINGTTGPCEGCGEYSVTVSYVTTIGYPGHPGHEMSALQSCINPDCGQTDLAG